MQNLHADEADEEQGSVICYSGKRDGLISMVSTLVSVTSGSGSSPDLDHWVVFLGKTFHYHNAYLRHVKVYK